MNVLIQWKHIQTPINPAVCFCIGIVCVWQIASFIKWSGKILRTSIDKPSVLSFINFNVYLTLSDSCLCKMSAKVVIFLVIIYAADEVSSTVFKDCGKAFFYTKNSKYKKYIRIMLKNLFQSRSTKGNLLFWLHYINYILYVLE